jgi:hypothetical protein
LGFHRMRAAKLKKLLTYKKFPFVIFCYLIAFYPSYPAFLFSPIFGHFGPF